MKFSTTRYEIPTKFEHARRSCFHLVHKWTSSAFGSSQIPNLKAMCHYQSFSNSSAASDREVQSLDHRTTIQIRIALSELS